MAKSRAKHMSCAVRMDLYKRLHKWRESMKPRPDFQETLAHAIEIGLKEMEAAQSVQATSTQAAA